jgi:hypothetical protein
MKVANRGERIRHKWNGRRGHLKINVAVDIRKKKGPVKTATKIRESIRGRLDFV